MDMDGERVTENSHLKAGNGAEREHLPIALQAHENE